FYAFSPFGNYSRSETDNHQHQNHLDRNRHNAQRASQWPRHDAAKQHLHQRKWTVVRFLHRELSFDYCNIFIFIAAERTRACTSTPCAELLEQYFYPVKISTLVLISLWKSLPSRS